MVKDDFLVELDNSEGFSLIVGRLREDGDLGDYIEISVHSLFHDWLKKMRKTPSTIDKYDAEAFFDSMRAFENTIQQMKVKVKGMLNV